MPGFVRAVVRLALMAIVTAGVLVAATGLGLPTAAVLGLALTAAGLVGLLGLSRRRAMVAVPMAEMTRTAVVAPVESLPDEREIDPVVAAMAPEAAVDPELSMPRWRRPSLLAARKADPTRVARFDRQPLRFDAAVQREGNVRTIRYAVVQLLDRPDDVLGRQLSDLMAGDEVNILATGGPYWEVACPDGLRGWVHRTTIGGAPAESSWYGRQPDSGSDSGDLLTAVLSARGLR